MKLCATVLLPTISNASSVDIIYFLYLDIMQHKVYGHAPPLFTTDAVFTVFVDHRVDLINAAKLPELQLKFDDQITRD